MTTGKDILVNHLKFIGSIGERIVTFPKRNDHFGNNPKITSKAVSKYVRCATW